MCDTQVLKADNGVWLSKNSDREPHEPQAVVSLPAVHGDRATQLRCTHIAIPQVPNRHAVILSKPCWIWGAEMGVNAHGLAIGNEAIFSRQRQREPALLGMDLLRLGLERARTCDEAIAVMGQLLETHGQGGPAGFEDQRFHYDSSFILADPECAWIMETAGREWVARPVADHAAISNALTLGDDWTRGKPKSQELFRRHDTRLLPWLARSRLRRQRSLAGLRACPRAPAFADLLRLLRQHGHDQDAPLRGSNGDLCMHAAGPIRRSQTTGSMVAWLRPDGPRLLVTATSAPCLSLYRPVAFDLQAHCLAPEPDRAPLWNAWEAVHRAALFDAGFRQKLRGRIAAIEADLLPEMMQENADLASQDRLLAAATREILAWPRPRLPMALTPARRLWRRPLAS